MTEATATKVDGALKRYQGIAYLVGVFLLVLTLVAIPFQIAGQPQLVEIVGPIHGFLYMVYIALAFDLAFKNRWSIRGSVLVLLAGTIPFLSFVAERIVTRKVRAGEKL